jgi:hypothetical protein
MFACDDMISECIALSMTLHMTFFTNGPEDRRSSIRNFDRSSHGKAFQGLHLHRALLSILTFSSTHLPRAP